MMHFDVVLSGDNTPISKIHQNSRLNHIFDLILNEIWHPKKLNLWLKKYCMGIWDIVMHLIFSLKSKVFKYFSKSTIVLQLDSPTWLRFFMKIWYYVLFSTISYIGPILATYGSPKIRPYCQYYTQYGPLTDSIKWWHKNACTLSKCLLDILLLYIMPGNIRDDPCTVGGVKNLVLLIAKILSAKNARAWVSIVFT